MLSNIVLLLAQLLWSERDGVMFLRAWTPSSLLPSPLSVSFPLSPLLTLPLLCAHTLCDGVGIVFAILAPQTARLLGYYFFFWEGGGLLLLLLLLPPMGRLSQAAGD